MTYARARLWLGITGVGSLVTLATIALLIREQFGLEPGQVIKLMRENLKPSSLWLWRTRTTGRKTKHLSKRSFDVGRFRCKSQRG
jgi:uncharacterized protein (TIGR03643 family)